MVLNYTAHASAVPYNEYRICHHKCLYLVPPHKIRVSIIATNYLDYCGKEYSSVTSGAHYKQLISCYTTIMHEMEVATK